MVWIINPNYRFNSWIGCGKGTNAREELAALCRLLYHVLIKGISVLSILGDSNVIID